MTIRFHFDWVDAGSSPDKLAEVTMASLRISAGGSTITAVIDRQSRRYSDMITVPLFNIAEWLVFNWFSVWHEVADTKERAAGFEARHNLYFAGDGFVLPKLTIAPISPERIDLQWTKYRPRHARIEFLEAGSQSVERPELEAELRTLIDSVLQRTQEKPETKTASEGLRRVWDGLNNLDEDEVEFSRAASLFGADPFDIDDATAAIVTDFWENSDPSVREDALALSGGRELTTVANWLSRAQSALGEWRVHNDWAVVRDELPEVEFGGLPWEGGYKLARKVRRCVGENGGPMDLDQGSATVPYKQVSPPSRRIQGLVGAGAPACVMGPRNSSSTRFVQARALGDYLGRSGDGYGVISSLATERQAQSRAFAAEFLAPAKSLRDRIRSEFVDSDQIEDLGREFRVSTEVVRRQVENHKIARLPFY